MKFCGCATSRLRFYVKLKNGRYFICVGEQKTDDRRQSNGLTVWPIASRVAAYLQLTGKKH